MYHLFMYIVRVHVHTCVFVYCFLSYTYIVGKIIQILKHSETEGDLRSSSDHQDQSKTDGKNEQNKETVEQRGMVRAKSGADNQSVPPAGREGEASQSEQ